MAISNGDTIQIPVINISEPTAAVGDAIIEAAAKYGFVYVESNGTGFTPHQVDRAFELSKMFFDSSRKEKAECMIGPDNKGWSAMHSEILDPEHQRLGDFKEAMNFGDFKHGKAQQPLPKSLAAHEDELNDIAQRCHDMCMDVLKLLAIGLKISDNDGGSSWFSTRHSPSLGPSGSILRFLHYPALPEDSDYQPEVDIRAGAHSDYGSITLLFQRPGQPGLEILTPSNSWSPVPVHPPGTNPSSLPPILVNIGDLLEEWTNGLLRSTVHRVIFPKEGRRGGDDRYSIAYFCHPANATELVPVPSKTVRAKEANGQGHSKRGGKVMTAEEHLKSRLAATYGWAKEDEATN